MTTYYDPRAARTVAGAEAETRRAQAEALRAETALRLQRERREMEREDLQERRRDKAQRRAAKAHRRAERRTAIRSTVTGLASAARSRAHSFVAAAAMGSPMFIAWGGQLAFATEVMHLGAAAPTLPVAMEGSVLYTAYLTHQAIDRGLPTGRYRLLTWTMAGNAAGMNLWHQVDKLATAADPLAGLQVGAIYAVSSLLGIVLWELNAGLKRQVASRRSGAEIRGAAWRRLRYPRLSWAAASIRAAQGCSIDEAWSAAWIDRYGVGPDAPRRDRRVARRVLRHQSRADRAAAKDGLLSIVDGSIVRADAAPMPPAAREAGERAIAEFRAWQAGGHLPVPPPVESIEPPRLDVPRIPWPAATSEVVSIEPGPIDRDTETSAPRPAPAAAGRSSRPQGEARSIEAAPVRRSIDEHRAALAAAIEAGSIEAQPSAEAIRKTLRCSPSTARQLRDELAEGGAAA
ncbi:DUF2637 domain-containing protein [Microbispora triticiradicis]|uniref:DUF2637 domain-containing protein n=2 Tax=Microbispora TaxID=2005 RepID=A0ABY3LQG4_9ACTN|nr:MULTISPECIES: DUF2637 domain-containing protein [Microbispora]TLP66527.1 DUF2637 domain-containing protein [Microbispora fusca]TYB47420.1 DUF2637 domain-containing protein [Microbispora tritici]